MTERGYKSLVKTALYGYAVNTKHKRNDEELAHILVLMAVTKLNIDNVVRIKLIDFRKLEDEYLLYYKDGKYNIKVPKLIYDFCLEFNSRNIMVIDDRLFSIQLPTARYRLKCLMHYMGYDVRELTLYIKADIDTDEYKVRVKDSLLPSTFNIYYREYTCKSSNDLVSKIIKYKHHIESSR